MRVGRGHAGQGLDHVIVALPPLQAADRQQEQLTGSGQPGAQGEGLLTTGMEPHRIDARVDNVHPLDGRAPLLELRGRVATVGDKGCCAPNHHVHQPRQLTGGPYEGQFLAMRPADVRSAGRNARQQRVEPFRQRAPAVDNAGRRRQLAGRRGDVQVTSQRFRVEHSPMRVCHGPPVNLQGAWIMRGERNCRVVRQNGDRKAVDPRIHVPQELGAPADRGWKKLAEQQDACGRRRGWRRSPLIRARGV